MTPHLNTFNHSAVLFKKLSAGVHINRHHEGDLWIEIEQYGAEYQTLFSTIGFELIIDQRGFAYFKQEQSTSQTHKLSQQFALFLLLLFEYQADNGHNPYSFEQWYLDDKLIEQLWQKHTNLFKTESITDIEIIKDMLNSASRIHFVLKEQNYYRLLPAIQRYLDLFNELAEQHKKEK
jgi:hypothetical protein